MSAGVRRLLMTSDTLGGVFSYSVELARALEPHGVAVALATFGGPLSRGQLAELRGARNLQAFESLWKLEWMDDPWDHVRASGEWLLQLEHRVAPDVIHLNGYAHGALPFRAPVLIAAHSCVLSWWRAVKREPSPPTLERYGQEVRRGLDGAQLVVAPSRAQLGALIALYGPVAQTRVIPNAVHPARYRCRSKQPFVLSAGRLWDQAKNAAALAAVAGEIEWPVELCGEIEPPGVGDVATPPAPALRLLGALSRGALAQRMASAAIYALPARYEPFGLSVLEAALSGCALVLGDIESLRENWHGAARFVAPDDQRELARTLRELIADPDARGALADAARKRAGAFTPQALGAAYLAAYADAARGAPLRGEEDSACAS